jgi:hypothetical protein
MKVELALDKEALIGRIHREYGIQIQHLNFLPKGEVSYCYIADCRGGERYFLKLFGESRQARKSVEREDCIQGWPYMEISIEKLRRMLGR